MSKGKLKWFKRLVKHGHAPIPLTAPGDPQKQNHGIHNPRSEKNLARASSLIQKGRTAEAFAKLDIQAGLATTPSRRMQITALVGDSSFKTGHFDDALSLYRVAATEAGDHPRAWVRPALAEVRANLRAAQVDDALTKARDTWARSAAQHEEAQRWIAQQQAHLDQGDPVIVKKRPHRASVVASRLGYLFLQEGEPAAAAEFFGNAITVNPNGGSRARHGLALVALAQGDNATAEQRAREAVLLGKFQKKTINVWPTLITAQQRQGKTGIDADLLAGISQGKISSVRARHNLALVRALREHHDPAWKSIASNWLATEGGHHPVIATEFKKLSAVEARLDNDSGAQNAAFAALLAKPHLLVRTEYLAAAKGIVRLSLEGGQAVDIADLAARGTAVYGRAFAPALNHGLALACIEAGQPDLARPMLQEVVMSIPSTAVQWGKSVWALARMESSLANHGVAAGLYGQFVNEPSIPLRLRLNGQIQYVKSLMASGAALSTDILPTVTDALAQVDDFDLILDFARQAVSAPAPLNTLAAGLFNRGSGLAMASFAAATNPSEAIGILFRLTRRQVYDFQADPTVVATWNGLDDTKRQWLWSQKREFWEYIALVVSSFTRTGQDDSAQQLIQDYLGDPATPIEGQTSLMAELTTLQIKRGRVHEAINTSANLVAIAPSSQKSAPAYYWLSLAARKAGDFSGSAELARRLQAAQGTPRLQCECRLDCKACLLRANLSLVSSSNPTAYTGAFRQACLDEIKRDLSKS